MRTADGLEAGQRVRTRGLELIGSQRLAGLRPLEFDARLVEEGVCRALYGHQQEAVFRRERDQVYSILDLERREEAFRSIHWSWFRRLWLAEPLEQALAERIEALSAVEQILIVSAPGAREEGAELFVAAAAGTAAKPTRLVLCLRAETLVQPERALRLLRHELLHVADMLEPAFGYVPWLDHDRDSPAYERLVRERYRVLWDTSIEGRLSRAGWTESDARIRCWVEFSRAFAAGAKPDDSAFVRLFDGPRPSHAELAALALSGGGSSSTRRGQRCSLCRLPTFERLVGSQLTEPVRVGIQADFPQWEPQQGVCPQCADLYAARSSLWASVGSD